MSIKKINKIREDYKKSKIDFRNIPDHPIKMFNNWFEMALELDKDNCDYDFTQINTEESSITYEIDKEIKEITTYRTFNCRAKVTDVVSLLGSTPLATKEISVSAEYIFELKKMTSISVK